jgi:formylmethanofuran dehydrogenase subunit C
VTKFNITNSEVEQLSDTGNNYKFADKAENIAISNEGDVVQTTGTGHKVEVGKSEGLLAKLWNAVKAFWTSLTGK